MKIEIHHSSSGDWCAVYVDGTLDSQGDPGARVERVLDLLGVVEVFSDDFLRGGDGGQNDHTASSLALVTAYRSERVRREAEAAELRRQAAELVARADQIGKMP